MGKLVYGVGVNDGKYPATIDGVKTKEYAVWQDMIRRCHSSKNLKNRPTYIGCTVSENFKSYSYFYEWCQNQIGFNVDCFELDKDLLSRGNDSKSYSEETCVFLPRDLNLLNTNAKSARGKYPIGVVFSKAKGMFVARVGVYKDKIICGYSDSPEDAFLMYKECKEERIKEVAEKYKIHIDPRAYEALMNYQVEITD